MRTMVIDTSAAMAKKPGDEPGALKDREIEERVRQLDQRIARADRLAAGAAAAEQPEIAEDRDVVVRPDLRVAVRAVARRKDDRFFARIAMDDDVEKAADDRAERERGGGKKTRAPCGGVRL